MSKRTHIPRRPCNISTLTMIRVSRTIFIDTFKWNEVSFLLWILKVPRYIMDILDNVNILNAHSSVSWRLILYFLPSICFASLAPSFWPPSLLTSCQGAGAKYRHWPHPDVGHGETPLPILHMTPLSVSTYSSSAATICSPQILAFTYQTDHVMLD